MTYRSKKTLRKERKKYRTQAQIANFKEKLETCSEETIGVDYRHTSPSEFEVQACLYNKLKNSGYKVRGEYSQVRGNRAMVRFDLIVFPKNRRPIIVEVKSGKSKKMVSKAQMIKYSKFNADLLYCIGIEQVDVTFNEVTALISDSVHTTNHQIS